MRKICLLLLLGLLPAFGQIAPSTKSAPARTAEQKRVFQERLQQLKMAMSVQVAVRDDIEGFRRGTGEEAAALAQGTGAPAFAGVRELPGGGQAVRADLSQLEFLVVTQAADGSRVLTHAPAAAAAKPAKAAKAAARQGGADVR
ncbi:MAG: hypothetical protein SFV54_10535 [Bryobacteraceae bacterium]|nr:hypothetical protein [Bryobacteraceae bacterium]